jgi:hypothetical protein
MKLKRQAIVIEKPIHVRSRGRFRAVVHTGHECDQFGNITKHGLILRETPFGNNKITNTGFSKLLSNTFSAMVMVAGAGNTAPDEDDTSLVSYLGKSNTVATWTTTRNTVPDGNNEVWWRVTARVTFAPSSMGGGAVNVAEAGITTGVAVGSVNSSTPVSARGLLVDGSDLPTTVSVDNAVEYLDIIWEYTEWVDASVTGVVSLDIDGVPTDFDYEVRPYYFDNTGGSFNYAGWAPPGSMSLPGFAPIANKSGYPRQYAIAAFAGPIGAITGNVLGASAVIDIPTAVSVDAYVANSKQRTFRTTWLPTEANIAGGGIGAIKMTLGHANFQVGFSPKIAKINTKQLDLYWTYAMANR